MDVSRNLSLSTRREFTREARIIEPPIQFTLVEIKSILQTV